MADDMGGLQAETPQMDNSMLSGSAATTALQGSVEQSALVGSVNQDFTPQDPGPGAFCPRMPKLPKLNSLIPKSDKPPPKSSAKYTGKVTDSSPPTLQGGATTNTPSKLVPQTPGTDKSKPRPPLKARIVKTPFDPPLTPGTPEEDTLEAKKARIEQRSALIKAAQSFTPSNPGQAAQLQAAIDRLKRNNDAVEVARLAQNVYQPVGAPLGWTRLNNSPALLPPGLQNAVFEDPKTGFRAALYRSTITGKYVLIFEGTNEGVDWVNNTQQALGWKSAQYEEAITLARQVKDVLGPNFTIGGHSLGGGLSAAASAVTGVPADTFNAAGLNPATVTRHMKYQLKPGQISNFSVIGEIVTSAQGPLTDLFTSTFFGLRVWSAAGSQYSLNALNPDGTPATGKSADPIKRHGMDFVIRGMEEQKTQDQQTIRSILGSSAP